MCLSISLILLLLIFATTHATACVCTTRPITLTLSNNTKLTLQNTNPLITHDQGSICKLTNNNNPAVVIGSFNSSNANDWFVSHSQVLTDMLSPILTVNVTGLYSFVCCSLFDPINGNSDELELISFNNYNATNGDSLTVIPWKCPTTNGNLSLDISSLAVTAKNNSLLPYYQTRLILYNNSTNNLILTTRLEIYNGVVLNNKKSESVAPFYNNTSPFWILRQFECPANSPQCANTVCCAPETTCCSGNSENLCCQNTEVCCKDFLGSPLCCLKVNPGCCEDVSKTLIKQQEKQQQIKEQQRKIEKQRQHEQSIQKATQSTIIVAYGGPPKVSFEQYDPLEYQYRAQYLCFSVAYLPTLLYENTAFQTVEITFTPNAFNAFPFYVSIGSRGDMSTLKLELHYINGGTSDLLVKRGMATKVENFSSFSFKTRKRQLVTSDVRIYDQCGNTIYVQKLLKQQLDNTRKTIQMSFTADYLLSNGQSFIQFFNLTTPILHQK